MAPLAALISVHVLLVLLARAHATSPTGDEPGGDGASEYCIVGAGPGGIQVALEMQHLGMDYALFEREPRAGTFFEVRRPLPPHPRHPPPRVRRVHEDGG